MKLKYRKLAFCLLLLFTLIHIPTAYANLLAHNSPTPGGIAIIPLPADYDSAPVVTYKGNRVLTIRNFDINTTPQSPAWVAVVGIPLSVDPGIHPIVLHSADGLAAQTITFKVTPKTYQTERINFKGYRPTAKHKTYIVTELERRILRELKEIEAIYRHWLEVRNITKVQLQLPIQGRKSSAFGLKRILNGMARSPHSGLDIAAPEGTPVKAPKAGVVIKTSHFYLTGNAIFIEHGQGFITSYFHLKKISVKVGDIIKQGKIIGLVGKTGRATGPHLHWSVSLNGVRVNPELLLAKGAS